jgi:hypothetical protein
LEIIKNRLSNTTNQSDESTLLEKKKIIQNRINRLTGSNDRTVNKNSKNNKNDKKSNDGSNKNHDEPENSQHEFDLPDNINESKLERLIRKLQKVKQLISKTKNENEKKILQDQAEKIKAKINKIGEQESNDDDNKGKNETLMIERPEILRNEINKKLSKTKDKPDERNFLEKKDIINKKLRQDNEKETDDSNKISKSNLNDLEKVNEKHSKIKNRISNTKDELKMRKRKKSILDKKLSRKSEGNSNGVGEMNINARLHILNRYLEKLEKMITQTSEKEKRKSLKEEKQLLNERISFLRKELDESDAISDTESINDRLTKLKDKLDIVRRRLGKENDVKTISTLERKMEILNRRIDGLTNELNF